MLRRAADGRESTGRGLSGVRRLQVAAESVWHGIFLGEKRALEYAPARSVLLDGGGGLGQFRGLELRGPQAGGERKALGGAGKGQPFQFQSGGHGYFR